MYIFYILSYYVKTEVIMFNSILLALSSSIDSLGIGITYGLKNTKINFEAKLILFIMSIFFATLSIALGNIIKMFLPDFVTNIISSAILVIIGFLILLEPIPFDFDNSHGIDIKEAIILRNCSFSRFYLYWHR